MIGRGTTAPCSSQDHAQLGPHPFLADELVEVNSAAGRPRCRRPQAPDGRRRSDRRPPCLRRCRWLSRPRLRLLRVTAHARSNSQCEAQQGADVFGLRTVRGGGFRALIRLGNGEVERHQPDGLVRVARLPTQRHQAVGDLTVPGCVAVSSGGVDHSGCAGRGGAHTGCLPARKRQRLHLLPQLQHDALGDPLAHARYPHQRPDIAAADRA